MTVWLALEALSGVEILPPMHLPGVSRLNAATSVSSRCLALVLAVWSLCASGAIGAEPENLDWPAYLGGKERKLYSPLKQIHRGNVTQLEVAWTYETGDKGEYQANNLIVDGVLYTASPSRKVIAIDAATGKELWKWDPAKERSGKGAPRQRGIVYWQSDTGAERRLY